ncbi:MAG TPA: universal stress protein [Solirubrobacterales bacterium]|jgi:nucleotide-binding universal stress UspA family protein|nr:universal stress protein [Solirubrobacterales bacterium]
MIEHVLVGVALLVGLGGGYLIARSRLHWQRAERPDAVHQILLPFTGTEISRRAVDAALRLARAEDATLMPAYLALVPKSLPLECAIPNEANKAMPMLEAIEQRATAQGVPVDARIERGRSYRHALARLLKGEAFDRVVVPASAAGAAGFSGDDLVWLLRKAPAEVLILRPDPEDRRVLSARRPPEPAPSAGRLPSPASRRVRSG